MKKLLYSSIILGAGLFAFGIQGNNVLTVKAADEVSAEGADSVSSDKIENHESVEKVDSQLVKEATTEDTNESSKEEPQEKSSQDSVPVSNDEENPVNPQQVATNRINKTKDRIPYIEIRPTDEAIQKAVEQDPTKPLANVDDPAYEGDLLVPYTYYGNGAAYVLDSNGQPIADSNTETGYQENRFEDIYTEIDGIRNTSSDFTGIVYGVIGDEEPTNKKEKMLKALKREGAFFMEYRNHGYSNLEELEMYVDAFKSKLKEIQSLNDDGTPVVKTPVIETTPITGTTTFSHHHSSSTTQSNAQTNDKLPLVVVAIRQAKLYSADGTEVTDRGLSDASVWMVDKVSTINGQKMYRISANEWVAESDVI
ncbi:hypothetical protein [Companilactobacillus nantensis]|uniref:Surface layer protein A domain-containing protein n=1 Tax=Companilactobacillus nantensis DSM 16982 TaxID=1423774 RepID=A0A0R1WGL1_9LACO|nr:hypothetical protein [Companilactobacillus nantensis]KRM17178.1 hypothetical protein FD31_GL000423 [Companilactobacillus nantensis DSM 16982]GEO64115.1 hypothetical protein LNA01_12980 [Companilactobacillus nantensis]